MTTLQISHRTEWSSRPRTQKTTTWRRTWWGSARGTFSTCTDTRSCDRFFYAAHFSHSPNASGSRQIPHAGTCNPGFQAPPTFTPTYLDALSGARKYPGRGTPCDCHTGIGGTCWEANSGADPDEFWCRDSGTWTIREDRGQGRKRKKFSCSLVGSGMICSELTHSGMRRAIKTVSVQHTA